MKKNGNFYQTTALVTFFGVAERALGFLYRIVLARLLGAEGLGLYQIALSHFSFFRTLGGGGLPVTTSRLVAKERAQQGGNEGGVLIVAGLISLGITLPLTLLFCLLPWTTPTLKILFIGLSLTCLYAIVKGFFWGKNKFLIPALLEFGEEIVGVIAGVLLLRCLGQYATAESGANFAAIACVIACAVSFFIALPLLFTIPKKERQVRALKPLFKEVAFAALPVTAMRAGSSLISSLIAILFPAMLMKAGASAEEATAAFGVATGMAFPLLSMPMTLVGSFALVLMPRLSHDYYQGNDEKVHQNVERGLTCAVYIACLLLPFFAVFGENIGLLTYDNLLAGEMLKYCCPLLLPMSFCMITNTALNSMGQEKKTLGYYLIGAAGTILCVLLLPQFLGVYAYAVGLFVQFVVVATLGAVSLFRRWKPTRFFLRKILLSLAFTLPVLLLGWGCLPLFARFCGVYLCMGLTAGVMVVAYVALYLAFGLISPKFARKILPKG